MAEVTERGDVFFFYRPKVDTERVASLDDVQRTYLILEPEGEGPLRRVELGRKALPPPGWAGRRHGWAFVDAVTRRGQELGEATAREEYETKTRGRRVQPEDRPVAEGVYALVRHDEHVHLVFAVELPSSPGPPQEELGILDGRSLVVEVKDPTNQRQGQRTPTSGRTEPLPDELQERFGGRRFVALDPPGFLDHEGVELLLMPAEEDDVVDVDLGARPERLEDAEFEDLGLAPDDLPTEALVEREWR